MLQKFLQKYEDLLFEKNPQAYKKFIKHKKKMGAVLIAGTCLEIGCFIGSYYLYRKMTRDQGRQNHFIIYILFRLCDRFSK